MAVGRRAAKLPVHLAVSVRRLGAERERGGEERIKGKSEKDGSGGTYY